MYVHRSSFSNNSHHGHCTSANEDNKPVLCNVCLCPGWRNEHTCKTIHKYKGANQERL